MEMMDVRIDRRTSRGVFGFVRTVRPHMAPKFERPPKYKVYLMRIVILIYNLIHSKMRSKLHP